jgi:hypothetical protein
MCLSRQHRRRALLQMEGTLLLVFRLSIGGCLTILLSEQRPQSLKPLLRRLLVERSEIPNTLIHNLIFL